MKLHKIATLVFALAAAAAVNAQTLTAKANIPFNFVVNGKTLPAGNYAISESSHSRTLVIRGIDNDTVALAIPTNVESAVSEGYGKLVFHRYGDRYFLSQAWVPGEGRAILPSGRVEKELSAKQNATGDSVLVALR
jgi:hypothetical protein